MTVEVRLMTDGDDVAAAGELVRRAYFALPGYPRDEEYDIVIGDVAGRISEAQLVVAFDDGRLVGCLTYVPDEESPHAEFDDEHAASFRYFGVDPSAQGRGVGEAMVQWCIDAARRSGRHRLRIHTLETMPGAQRLYLRMGFEREPAHDENWDGIVGLAYVYHC